jgi:hypothetical protein
LNCVLRIRILQGFNGGEKRPKIHENQ